jgi:hypothetical protein
MTELLIAFFIIGCITLILGRILTRHERVLIGKNVCYKKEYEYFLYLFQHRYTEYSTLRPYSYFHLVHKPSIIKKYILSRHKDYKRCLDIYLTNLDNITSLNFSYKINYTRRYDNVNNTVFNQHIHDQYNTYKERETNKRYIQFFIDRIHNCYNIKSSKGKLSLYINQDLYMIDGYIFTYRNGYSYDEYSFTMSNEQRNMTVKAFNSEIRKRKNQHTNTNNNINSNSDDKHSHPKYKVFVTLCKTIKLRTEQLNNTSGEERKSLVNELNAVKRKAKKLKDKYNF